MSIIDRFNTNLQKAFNEYTESYLGKDGAAFLPTKTEYDIAANRAAAKVPSQTLEGTFPGIMGKVLGTASDIAMPAIAFGASPFYDLYQASDRARDKYGQPDVRSVVDDAEIPMGPSLPEYAKAVADENILRSAIGRAAGAGQNLVDRFSRINKGIGDILFTRAAAPETTQKERQSIDITDQLNDYYEKGEMMDNVVEAPENGIIAALKDKINPADLLNLITNLYSGGIKESLTGIGIGKAFDNIRSAIGNRLGPASYGTSQAAFNAMTPSQQQAVGSIYGQGGIMQGYNPVSAFGRGPASAIQNRIDNILGRKAPQTRISKQRVKDLQTALTNVGGAGRADSGSSFDSNTGGTFGTSTNDASTFSDYS